MSDSARASAATEAKPAFISPPPPAPGRPDRALPCVGICRMSEDSGLCQGCWRTRDELRAWKASDDE